MMTHLEMEGVLSWIKMQCTHFTDVQTEAQGPHLFAQGHKWQSWAWNSRCLLKDLLFRSLS